MAIASDCNPGSSPIVSLLMIMNMACILFGLTPTEALLGVTRHAASALGISSSHGALEVGKVADCAVWDIKDPRELSYMVGGQPLSYLIKGGHKVNLSAL